MTPRLVVFDVDGTLIDSQAHILGAMATAHAELDLAMPPREAVLAIVGLSLPQAVARLHPGADSPIREALVEGYKTAFGAMRAQETSPLYPGARAVLEALVARDDVVLGIATGKSRRGLGHVLAAHGLEGWFATCQVADDHPSKPHPAMLEAALHETGLPAETAVMIGDTSFDIAMGRAAGFRTLGVSWGYHPPEALRREGANLVLEGFDDLTEALESLWAGR